MFTFMMFGDVFLCMFYTLVNLFACVQSVCLILDLLVLMQQDVVGTNLVGGLCIY